MGATSTAKTTHRLVRWLRGVMAALIVLGGVAVSQAAYAQDDGPKIGYVNLREAMSSVEEGKAAKQKLQSEIKAKQKKLNQKKKELQELKKKLSEQQMALSDEAKKKKTLELQRKMAELQQMYMKLQRDLSKKEAKVTKEIFGKMRKVVQEIAEERGYDLVLEKQGSSVLYAKDSMDLTDELIERFDSK